MLTRAQQSLQMADRLVNKSKRQSYHTFSTRITKWVYRHEHSVNTHLRGLSPRWRRNSSNTK